MIEHIVLSKIIDISNLPHSLYINSDWEVGMLLSEYDYVSNKGYIPKSLCGAKDLALRYCDIDISDLELDSNKPRQYITYDLKSTEFDCTRVDEYIENVGAHNILIEFKGFPCFIVGLDKEFLLILFEKKNETFANVGGLKWFKTIFDEQCLSGLSAIEKEDLDRLKKVFYGDI